MGGIFFDFGERGVRGGEDVDFWLMKRERPGLRAGWLVMCVIHTGEF